HNSPSPCRACRLPTITGLRPAAAAPRPSPPPRARRALGWEATVPRPDTSREVTPVLSDAYGRIATDLRVSLTDRCNLRCTYCMPPEGLDWLPNAQLLTADEVVRLVAVGVERLGITEVRYTGGEPLLRRELPDIVARTTALDPRPQASLTTNGIGL